MSKVLIITILAIVIAIGATAVYITQRQGRQVEVVELPPESEVGELKPIGTMEEQILFLVSRWDPYAPEGNDPNDPRSSSFILRRIKELPKPESLLALQGFLNHQDLAVRLFAIAGLYQYVADAFMATEICDTVVTEVCTEEIVSLIQYEKYVNLDLLAQRLNDEDPEIRAIAAGTLLLKGDTRGVKVLEELIGVNEPMKLVTSLPPFNTVSVYAEGALDAYRSRMDIEKE